MIYMIFNSEKTIFKTSQGDIGYGTTIFHWPKAEFVVMNELMDNYNKRHTDFICAEKLEIYEWEEIYKIKGKIFPEELKQYFIKDRLEFESKWNKDYSSYPVVRYAKQK